VVIDYLREKGLINDRRYAERLFELLKDKKDGMRAIRRKMLARQIPSRVVDAVLKDFRENGGTQDLERIIDAARVKLQKLNAKYGKDPVKKYQVNSKLYAWLAMRGFGPDESREILRKLAKK
jgi:regulatory protein